MCLSCEQSGEMSQYVTSLGQEDLRDARRNLQREDCLCNAILLVLCTNESAMDKIEEQCIKEWSGGWTDGQYKMNHLRTIVTNHSF